MASVHEAPSNAERGAQFEQLMVSYFQLDPMPRTTSTRSSPPRTRNRSPTGSSSQRPVGFERRSGQHDQHIPVTRIGLAKIAGSPISWDIVWPSQKLKITLEPAAKNEPRPHQGLAIEKVFTGGEQPVRAEHELYGRLLGTEDKAAASIAGLRERVEAVKRRGENARGRSAAMLNIYEGVAYA